MCVIHQIIICGILILPALCSAQNQPGFFVSAPDVIRVGVTEKVLISVHNTGGASSVKVQLLLQSYPLKAIIYDQQNITVESDQPQVVTLQVSPDDVDFVSKKDIKQYATLVVKSDTFEREKDILLSYKSGYVFIQTDKPIYTPKHNVNIRVISLDQQMKPSNVPIKLEIRNPQHIIVKQLESATSESGFIVETFAFPSYPMFGNWSVVAFYGHKQQHNTTVKFFVKEYVLPTFSVAVNLNKQYLLPDDTELVATLIAKTTYGAPVRGIYHVKFSILSQDGNLSQLPHLSASGKLDSDGLARSALKTTEIAYDWADLHKGSRLHIHATVTEESSGQTETTNNTQVIIVDTPYKFKLDNTVRYFKRGLPFEIKADVKLVNGQGAVFVPVDAVVKADTQSGGEIEVYSGRASTNLAGQITFKLDVPVDASKLCVRLSTANPAITDRFANYNANKTFELDPQQSSRTDSYLVAQILTQRIEAGRTMQAELKRINKPGNTTLHMFVVSKGQIVSHKTTSSVDNSVRVNIDVTFDMVPHARLIAYFVDDENQVVADSVWFSVEHNCDVGLRTPAQQDTKYKPKNEIELRVTGEPGSQVGLLAIDVSVFSLQDSKINNQQVTKKMDNYDLGCGPGGGVDSADVFMGSGVTVITNADLSTETRQDESCAQSSARKRKRRDTADGLSNLYPEDSMLQTYCDIGAAEHWRNSTASITACAMAAEVIALEEGLSLVDARIQAFYNCCIVVNFEEEEEDQSEEEEEHVRSDFPDTWFFDQVKIGDAGSTVYSIVTPDSATTWVIQAVGVSSERGICVANQVEVKVQPDVFIQLHMPYTIVRREQVEIVATVYNYFDEDLPANVSLLGVDGLCSEAVPGEWSTPRKFDNFHIPANDSVTVKFNIVPLGVGKFPIEIRVQTPRGDDTIRESITIVPEGIQMIDTLQINVNPSESNPQTTNLMSQGGINNSNLQHQQVSTGSYNHQKDHISITLPTGTVPNSAVLKMHVSGDPLGQAITTVIHGQSLLSNQATPENINNGEMATADTASNVYILKYLKATNQMTADAAHTLQQNIESAVTTQYVYRKEETGAFTYVQNIPFDNVWLTAFASKVLCHAHEFHSIDPVVTSTATDWLIGHQETDGSFEEDIPSAIVMAELRGALGNQAIGNHAMAMTAYVLIALLECNSTQLQSHTAMQSAASYLEDQLDELERPYDLAIVTYALALVGSPFAYVANQRLRDIATIDEVTGTYHWEEQMSSRVHQSRSHWYAISIETTGYALLAQLQLGALSYSHDITRWLSQQSNYNGGFVQVQDTVIALQALSHYALYSSGQKTDLKVTFTNDIDNGFYHTVHIHPENAVLQRTIHGPVDGQIIVDSKGTGTGQLAVQLKYHTVEDSTDTCQFQININAGDGNFADEYNTTFRSRRSLDGSTRRRRRQAKGITTGHVHVCTRYMGNAEFSNMAVIDVGLYSGFRPLEHTLTEITSHHSAIVQRYEITNRSVIFFVKQIPNVEELCLTFDTIQAYRVGKPQPVAVRVYDYQEPDIDCVKFYHPEMDRTTVPTTLPSVCQGQTCICAAAKCPDTPCDANANKAKYCNTTYEQLLNAMCPVRSSDPKTQSTFAYKIRFHSRSNASGGFEIINMDILSAFVFGNDTALQRSFEENPNQTIVRPFWRSLNCQQFGELRSQSSLDGGGLLTTRTYLVIGTGGFSYQDENGEESFKYILDDTYIFEDWPTGNRALPGSRQRRFRAQVEKLERLRTEMSPEGTGCPLS